MKMHPEEEDVPMSAATETTNGPGFQQDGGGGGAPPPAPAGDQAMAQRKRKRTRVSLRLLSLLTCIVMIGLFGSALYVHLRSQGLWNYRNTTTEITGLVYAVIAASWDISDLAVLYSRSRISNIILLSTHVAVEIILWGGGGITSLIFLSFDMKYFRQCSDRSDTCQVYGRMYIAKSHLQKLAAALAFTVLLTGIHLAFFVLACIEVHKRNKELQVENILEALRLNGLDIDGGKGTNPKSPGAYAARQGIPRDVGLAVYGRQPPPQELQATPAPPRELPTDPAYTPEMAGDRSFPVEIASGRD